MIPKGETDSFLICIFKDAESVKAANETLRGEGIISPDQGVTNVVMNEGGLHIYYKSTAQYARGTCGHADDLFASSLLLAIPSCLSSQDETDIITAFTNVLTR